MTYVNGVGMKGINISTVKMARNMLRNVMDLNTIIARVRDLRNE